MQRKGCSVRTSFYMQVSSTAIDRLFWKALLLSFSVVWVDVCELCVNVGTCVAQCARGRRGLCTARFPLPLWSLVVNSSS